MLHIFIVVLHIFMNRYVASHTLDQGSLFVLASCLPIYQLPLTVASDVCPPQNREGGGLGGSDDPKCQQNGCRGAIHGGHNILLCFGLG